MTTIFAPIRMIGDQVTALVARNGNFFRRSGPVRAHQSCRRRPEGTGCHRSCRGWRRSEPVDTAQDVGEQVTRNDNLGHLERDVAPVAHNLRFRNGAFPVKLLLSIDRGRDTILRSRSSGAWGAFVLPVSFATNSLTSLCRSPGSCFRPWSARRLPTSCLVQNGSRVPISNACSNTASRFGDQAKRRASSGTASRRRDTGGRTTVKRGSFLLSLLSADGMQPRLCHPKRHRLVACEAELGAVPPRPVKHHADAPGQRNRCAFLASHLRQTLRPDFQPVRSRPVQHHRGGLIQRSAQPRVAGLRNPAGHISFAGLVPSRRQTHPRPNIFRSPEALGGVDRGRDRRPRRRARDPG